MASILSSKPELFTINPGGSIQEHETTLFPPPYHLAIVMWPIVHHSNVRSLTFHTVSLRRGSIQYSWLVVNQIGSDSLLVEYLHPGPSLTSLAEGMKGGEGRGVLKPDGGALRINDILIPPTREGAPPSPGVRGPRGASVNV